jgi:hypothetical protein
MFFNSMKKYKIHNYNKFGLCHWMYLTLQNTSLIEYL